MLRLFRALGVAAAVAALAGGPRPSPAQAPPPREPQVLLYSDDPEYVSQDGLLFSSLTAVDASTPARAYLYHVLQDASQQLDLIVATAGTSSQVQLAGGAAAGDVKPMYVGHRATVEYLRARKGPGSVATVAAGAPLVFPVSPSAVLSAGAAVPGRPLVEAIYDLRVLAGDPVRLSVVAVHPGADPLAAAAQPLPGDGFHRRGEFGLAGVPPVRLQFTVGDPCDDDHACDTFAAGMASVPELHGGRPLGGEYGVLRPVELTMTNPTPVARDVFLYEQAGTAGVTTTIAFDGDDAPTEVPCLTDLDTPYLVKRFTVPPGTTTVSGVYLTDGGSHFPLELGLTATPPAPAADQCAAKPYSPASSS